MSYQVKIWWKHNVIDAEFEPDTLEGIQDIGFNGPWFVANTSRETHLISVSNVERILLPEGLKITIAGPGVDIPGGGLRIV